ncbi:SusC/RagA family TonB-linked outer membrane protein [Sphingobacterium bambusae]|uniref:SusC/RagA family TonB-linked outer membrane protein n=1 Tax=Sphingobacterium bambusae TaxID=662858 RepID=A0ABW6BKG5_9SPHI|nr:SusC/RagA family TonB-linked outer membrane protein [Sphingobacterium bambusae]WPL49461.1 SusC/RagA family TonB-linked outer membrane protein [Sphingobacterium bambusae]
MKKHYFLYVMKLTFFFILLGLLHVNANSYSQSVTLKGSDLSLSEIASAVRKQTGYAVSGNSAALKQLKPITMDVKNMPLDNFLDLIVRNQNVTYRKEGRNIILRPNSPSSKTTGAKISKVEGVDKQGDIDVRGRVVDSLGNGLVGITVSAYAAFNDKTIAQVSTDKNGEFTILGVPRDGRIVVTAIGYVATWVNAKPDVGTIVLRIHLSDLEEVVVKSGFVDRKRETFTGAANTVTGAQLLQNGNQNILQSLKNIDPAFRLMENLEMGSNPNNMPDLVLRGKSSIPNLTGEFDGTPNMPLFILDGFETTVQRIYDMDMNRVKSVTILKDATAKAIYGAKAGNGVVVIESIQPEAGRVRINYNGKLNLEAPDLTGYKLMDAKEKLQWEKDHNMWNSSFPDVNNYRESIYNEYYQKVYLQGVDTYWLSQPLQVGVGQQHSLNVDGGDEAFRYSASLNYNDIVGAMKGSNRTTTTINNILSYRYKNLIIRNTLEYSNNLGKNSPYGSFSEYVGLNPYYSPYDKDGKLAKIAGFYPATATYSGAEVFYNPLYNASLNTIDQNKYLQFVDNFYAEYRMDNNWRVTASLGFTQQRNSSDRFIPPSHTNFINYDSNSELAPYKGQWTTGNGTIRNLETNTSVNYTNTIGRNILTGSVTLNTNDQQSRNNSFIAEGFANDFATDISLASSYQRAAKPGGSDSWARTVGVVGIFNYSFDQRFNIDASYRTQGSSQYGANARWGNFWSVGTSYNFHREAFIKELGFSELRIRGSVGYTGSQNSNYSAIMALGTYLPNLYNGQRGIVLSALPNPDLRWQKKMDYNAGADLAIWESKFSARVDFYRQTTNDQVTSMEAAPSTGFPTYMANIGQVENSGFEANIRYQAFNHAETKSFLNIAVGATKNKNVLKKLSGAFTSYNENVDKILDGGNETKYSKPVARFVQGQSMDAIWAVRSLGINPANGNEVFLDRAGYLTDIWSSADLIVAGDQQPKLNGNVNVSAGYKGLILSLTGTYRFGGKLYNSTLVDRVENINGKGNLDIRILDAWRQPGDNAIYRAPQVGMGSQAMVFTNPTTRFVQRNNEFYFSTINLSYDVQSQVFLKRLGLERLRATVYSNEVLRLSSIDIERGTSYPFARNFSFAINATF